MAFPRNAFLAALAVAATLPVSGPIQAESRMIHLDVDESAPAGSPDSIVSDGTAPVADASTAKAAPFGQGMASYYGRQFAGAKTASGQRFDPAALTAAHRTLPFGTRVQVTNAATGSAVVVTINDRGPFHGNRVIDLSEAAAREIGLVRTGSGMVQLAVLTPGG